MTSLPVWMKIGFTFVLDLEISVKTLTVWLHKTQLFPSLGSHITWCKMCKKGQYTKNDFLNVKNIRWFTSRCTSLCLHFIWKTLETHWIMDEKVDQQPDFFPTWRGIDYSIGSFCFHCNQTTQIMSFKRPWLGHGIGDEHGARLDLRPRIFIQPRLSVWQNANPSLKILAIIGADILGQMEEPRPLEGALGFLKDLGEVRNS